MYNKEIKMTKSKDDKKNRSKALHMLNTASQCQ